MSKRTIRVAERLKKDVSMILLRRINDPRIIGVTITGADISPDLRHARIYWVSGGTEQDKESAAAGLKSATNLVKRELGRGLNLRNVPHIRFIHDDTLDKANHIENLIEQVMEKERAAREKLQPEGESSDAPDTEEDFTNEYDE